MRRPRFLLRRRRRSPELAADAALERREAAALRVVAEDFAALERREEAALRRAVAKDLVVLLRAHPFHVHLAELLAHGEAFITSRPTARGYFDLFVVAHPSVQAADPSLSSREFLLGTIAGREAR